MNRIEILTKAAELTQGDRNKTYGDPYDNHTNIAALWNAYMGIRTQWRHVQQPFDAEDVMIMMALMKVARVAQRLGNPTDSLIDACAYIAMASEARDKIEEQRA